MFDDLLDQPDQQEESSLEEGLKAPRVSNECLGHEHIEKNLLDLYQQEKMPHALVFAGPKGIGKATFAYRFARFLFHDQLEGGGNNGLFGADETLPIENFSVPLESVAFQKIASGGLSDLMVIEREYDATKGKHKGAIGVDSIRKITPFLYSTAAYGGWRVIIIDDADTMNRNAQNALLKNLEEPPKNCLIILICHQLGKFLPTIRSRVRLYEFSPLRDAVMSELLSKAGHAVSPEDQELVLMMSSGSIGLAQEFLTDGGLDVVHKVLECFDVNQTEYRAKSFKLANSLSQKGADQALLSFKTFLTWLCRFSTKLKALGAHDLDEIPALSALAPVFKVKGLQGWVETTDSLVLHFDQCDKSNLDRHYTVYHAMEILGT